MINNKKKIIKIQEIILNYILDLDEKEIDEVIENKKEITIMKKVELAKQLEFLDIKKDKKLDDIDEHIKWLNIFKTREEAEAYFRKKTFTIKILKEIAKRSEIYIKSRSKRIEIIDKIIAGTIDATIKHKILKKENNYDVIKY